MHREPDVGFDPGSAGSRPGPKAGAKPLRHPGIPLSILQIEDHLFLMRRVIEYVLIVEYLEISTLAGEQIPQEPAIWSWPP